MAETFLLEFERQIRESDEAICFEVEGAPVWIPRSLIGEIDDEARTVETPVWWLTKKGLI